MGHNRTWAVSQRKAFELQDSINNVRSKYVLIYQAKAFYNAAINLELMDRESDHSSGDFLFQTPATVNAAFSIEITLKAILTCEGIAYKREHNLFVLYTLLPEQAQYLIFKWMRENVPEYDSEAFIKEFVLISDAFVQWRYSFEEGIKPAFDMRFLMGFATAAIMAMFELGYNVDITPGKKEKSDEEILQMFEDNRRQAYEKNLDYIRSAREKQTP